MPKILRYIIVLDWHLLSIAFNMYIAWANICNETIPPLGIRLRGTEIKFNFI